MSYEVCKRGGVQRAPRRPVRPGRNPGNRPRQGCRGGAPMNGASPRDGFTAFSGTSAWPDGPTQCEPVRVPIGKVVAVATADSADVLELLEPLLVDALL